MINALRAQILPAVQFAFRGNRSRADKLRGLVEFGPYGEMPLKQPPTFGFVFPSECRDQANRLFLYLKNGVGPFKGVESTFRFPLKREQVFSVTGFSVQNRRSHDAARIYADAILDWHTSRPTQRPDLFFILHPQTSQSELDTPYYACKARLLREGILSQNVTLELINDEAKFRWSAANIALAAFAKLGGIPWVVYGEDGEDLDQNLIIGLGRAYLYDPATRHTNGYMGFTACFSSRGVFKFVALAEVTDNRHRYLELLGKVVSDSLGRAEQMTKTITSLTLHIPKDMSKQEDDAVRNAVQKHPTQKILQITAVRVSDDPGVFAIDDRFRDGVPQRGTVIHVGEDEYLLYTEGRDEKENWVGLRPPVALRVTPQSGTFQARRALAVLRQINDLSQVNWRGFNARSQPISVYYGSLITRLLSHIPAGDMSALAAGSAHQILEERMWFL